MPFLPHLLAQPLRFYMQRPLHLKYFHVWEAYGFHITPAHYYSPIPDMRLCPDSIWSRNSEMPGVDMNDAVQHELLISVFPRYENECGGLFHNASSDRAKYHPSNPCFSGIDAAVLYCMVRHFHPRKILEVGGGFSTRVSAAAAVLNEQTALTCIEPYPDEVLAAGFPGLTELISKQVQDVDLCLFENLTSSDILFIDSSHVAKCGNDVVYLYLEVLPRLKPGVIVHIHDIFFPREYPESFAKRSRFFWNEQYLVQAFLAFNDCFEVLFCSTYALDRWCADVAKTFRAVNPLSGCSLWIRRKETRMVVGNV